MTTTEDGLRERLIASLRPRMTRVEAEMTVDCLIDEVRQYADVVVGRFLAAQEVLIAQIIAAAQDIVETMKEAGDGSVPVPPGASEARVPGQ